MGIPCCCCPQSCCQGVDPIDSCIRATLTGMDPYDGHDFNGRYILSHMVASCAWTCISNYNGSAITTYQIIVDNIEDETDGWILRARLWKEGTPNDIFAEWRKVYGACPPKCWELLPDGIDLEGYDGIAVGTTMVLTDDEADCVLCNLTSNCEPGTWPQAVQAVFPSQSGSCSCTMPAGTWVLDRTLTGYRYFVSVLGVVTELIITFPNPVLTGDYRMELSVNYQGMTCSRSYRYSQPSDWLDCMQTFNLVSLESGCDQTVEISPVGD